MSDDIWCDDYDYDDDLDTDCDHAEYDVGWDGIATCERCGEHWAMSGEQLKARYEAEARWMTDYDRMMRREQSPFWRTIDWLRSMAARMRPRIARAAPATDDDIPF